ncbi:MAG: hypothetical protein PSX36_10600 [bacterium]|nr:hypothetical protein [bacterium]
MSGKSKSKITDLVKSFDMKNEYKEELLEFMFYLAEQGIDVHSSNLLFKIEELRHDNFRYNRIIDLSGSKNNNHWEVLRSDTPAHPTKLGNEGDIQNYESYVKVKAKLSEIRNTIKAGRNVEYSEDIFSLKRDNLEIMENMQNVLNGMKQEIQTLKTDLEKTLEENHSLKIITTDILFREQEEQKTLYIPIEIYLDTDNPVNIYEVYEAVMKFVEIIDFKKVLEFKAIKGSWWKKIIAGSKKALTSKEVTDRLREIEYSVEVNTIIKPQSEADKNYSEALFNILNSIKDIKNAAVRIGALIVVKVTNAEGEASIQTRTLSIKELHILNKKPELLSKPAEILLALANAVDQIGFEETGNN